MNSLLVHVFTVDMSIFDKLVMWPDLRCDKAVILIHLLHYILESHIKVSVQVFEDWPTLGPFYLLLGSSLFLDFDVLGPLRLLHVFSSCMSMHRLFWSSHPERDLSRPRLQTRHSPL